MIDARDKYQLDSHFPRVSPRSEIYVAMVHFAESLQWDTVVSQGVLYEVYVVVNLEVHRTQSYSKSFHISCTLCSNS